MLLLKTFCRVRIFVAIILLVILTVVGVLKESWVLSSDSKDNVRRDEYTTISTNRPTTAITNSEWQPQTLKHEANIHIVPKEISSNSIQTSQPPPPTTRSSSPSIPSSSGYVLALDYWEQQSSALRNLQNLQCWASQHDLSVLEPTMSHSQLKTPLNSKLDTKKKIWFRNVFDIDMWNRLSLNKNHSTLESWDKFLSSAPKNVVLVSVRYAFPPEIKQNLKKLSSSHTESQNPLKRVQQGCSTNWNTVNDFLHKNNFKVVKEICFNFAYGDRLSNRDFNSLLYGSLSPHETTVVFSQWRGSGPPARVLINDIECGNTRIQEVVGPSQQLHDRVRQYQQTYLMGQPYIAIMARMEKVQAFLKDKRNHLDLNVCFTHLLSEWREAKKITGLNSTLLAIDIGKYGSNSIHNVEEGSEMDKEFQSFFRALYEGKNFTVQDWESSFEDVAHITDSGYIAMIQKMLVVEAECVVFIGGGSFQKHAQTLYVQSHHNNPCVRVIDICTQASNLHITSS